MTTSFILNGVTTDISTLETGLLGLAGLPGADATTVETAQRFYDFITTTEANPFHDPRALQQEILRLVRTDPAVLKVFMRALSLQSGWKPPTLGKRFAQHVDFSFLKGRGNGPAQLSAGAVAPVKSRSPASASYQTGAEEDQRAAIASLAKNYHTAMADIKSGDVARIKNGLRFLKYNLSHLVWGGLFQQRDYNVVMAELGHEDSDIRKAIIVDFIEWHLDLLVVQKRWFDQKSYDALAARLADNNPVVRERVRIFFQEYIGWLLSFLQKSDIAGLAIVLNPLSHTVRYRENVEQILPVLAKIGRLLSLRFSFRKGVIIFRDYPGAFLPNERINRLKKLAEEISQSMDGDVRGEFRENIHNHPSRANLEMIDRYLARARSDGNGMVIRLLEEAKVLCEEIYNRKLNLNSVRDILNEPHVSAKIAWPEGELDLVGLGRLAVSVRDAFDSIIVFPEDRYHLMRLADSLDQVAFGLCALNEGEAGTAAQVRKMATLVQVLYGSGFGNKGYLEVAQRLSSLAEEWDLLNSDVREARLRIEGALIHHMLVDYQNVYREIFVPLVRDYGDALGIPQEERVGYASAKYRATGVFQLAVHLESLGVRGGLDETSARVFEIMSGEPWNRGPLQTFAYGSQGFPSDLREVGGKGTGLDWLVRRVPEMVPKGFVISSREGGHKLSTAEKRTIREAIKKLERKMGKKLSEGFSVSVRSGGAVSMSGAMATVLNVTNEDALFAAMEKVYASWNSPASREIREEAGIPAEWGTAVNVVEMVDGTGKDSGSGVAVSDSIPVYVKGKRGDEVVSGRDKATDKLPYALRKTLSEKIRGFEEELGYPVQVEFTVERKKLYLLQIRPAHRTRERLIRWYSNRVKWKKISKETAIRALGGRGVLELAKEVSVVEGSETVAVTEMVRGHFGEGAPSVREVAFDSKDIAEIHARGGLAVYVTSNPDAGVSVPSALQAGALIASGGNVLAHLFDVARSSNTAFVAGLDSAAVFKKGDAVTLDPANHRVLRGRYKIRTGPSPVKEDIEFLLRR
ncbi:MAG: hypothetical protein A3H42_02980 [Deltaproteobacteria bacterium RIFCSPLOWO2_02_FULL_46_8]|nr:MAG: hypothetical protein A3H42_02980 [Deltaproteobacteria bacterium RIFCSPLOWO2_02_FULL_46_8]